MTFEQLMPKPKLTHWLHAHFLKLCFPNPLTLVYAPLNLAVFLRLLVHVVELGYPAHWSSALLAALLEGEIATTARAPYPSARDVVEYTVMFPPLRTEYPHVPHFMLVFDDEIRFGKLPKAGAVCVLTTFRWTAKDQSVTFWMHEDSYEGMVAENWLLYLWRTDSWENVMQGEALASSITDWLQDLRAEGKTLRPENSRSLRKEFIDEKLDKIFDILPQPLRENDDLLDTRVSYLINDLLVTEAEARWR
ncbi:hypothetical protein INS49_006599 [Diaporthe citri]|uniref:uncharacterized protein n=1 Tax=Diaporthe citri TaxID=83186 RepID=UPI001C7F2667|nr:uncharacterized protein INS49_006599 [Diaporthe citri]KAG6364994.1 hypothetical protein INS49_006599 [Diaporthe citri]